MATAAGGLGAALWSHRPTAAGASEDVIFARSGKSNYAVFVDSSETQTIKHAAAELVDYVQRVTGIELPLVDESSDDGSRRGLLIIGKNSRHAEAFGTIDHLGDDGYTMRRRRHHVLIAGTSDLGTLHGVYAMVEDVLGVRWLTATETAIPSRRGRLTIPGKLLNRDSVPRFRFRHCHYGEAQPGVFRHHRQLNGRRDWFDDPVPDGLDVWSSYWPEEKYLFFKDLVDDENLLQDNNIKFMSTEARDQAVPKVIAFLEDRIADGDDPVVGLIQWDWATWEADPDSAAFAETHGGAKGAAMFDFVNEVAERVAEVIPAARLETEAYVWSIVPPTDMRIRDNVVITVCPIWAVRGQSLFHPANEKQTGYLRDWAKLANNLVLWDYQTSFSTYLEPYPQWFDGFETIKKLAEIEQFQGAFIQGPWNTKGAEMGPLRIWVHSQLLRDPSLDAIDLVDQFLSDYFGDAGPYIREYMDLMWSRKNELQDPLPEGSRVLSPLYDFDTISAADVILARAENVVVENADLVQRVQIARFNLDYVIFMRAPLYFEDIKRTGSDWDLDLVNRKERSQAAVKASGISMTSEGGGDPQALVDNYNTSKPTPAEPPRAVAGLDPDQWRDFQEVYFTIYPATTAFVQDGTSSNNQCARMDPKASEWGVQVPLSHLPGGAMWRLFVSVRTDSSTAQPTDIALTAGVYPPFDVLRSVTIGELADQNYHELELPGTYDRDSEELVFVHNITTSTAVYVDRIFAIKV